MLFEAPKGLALQSGFALCRVGGDAAEAGALVSLQTQSVLSAAYLRASASFEANLESLLRFIALSLQYLLKHRSQSTCIVDRRELPFSAAWRGPRTLVPSLSVPKLLRYFEMCSHNVLCLSLPRWTPIWAPRSMTERFLRPASTFLSHDGAVMADDSSPPAARNTTPYPTLTRPEKILTRIPEANLISICGGLAGAASAIVSCPLDVIKTKLQAQGGFRTTSGSDITLTTKTYHGVRGTAATIWTEEGIWGLYRGLGPLLLGYVPTWAVYLTVYNKAQRYFNSKTGEDLGFQY